jgi:hypothetical protein
MKLLDTDGDGLINFPEFVNWWVNKVCMPHLFSSGGLHGDRSLEVHDPQTGYSGLGALPEWKDTNIVDCV